MTILEQMRDTQIPRDSSRSAYERLEVVRDAVINEHGEGDDDSPNQIYYYVEVRKK